jgi:hypothetical protein
VRVEHGAAHLPAWAVAIEASPLGEAMRHSTFLYPVANLLHLLGLTLLVGSVILMDLRLLGLGRSLPLAQTVRALTPTTVIGLLIMAASGFSLFSADAGPLSVNPVFRVKIVFIGAAVANAILFRVLWQRHIDSWSQTPMAARTQAALSLLLWLAAATSGRLIAYF